MECPVCDRTLGWGLLINSPPAASWIAWLRWLKSKANNGCENSALTALGADWIASTSLIRQWPLAGHRWILTFSYQIDTYLHHFRSETHKIQDRKKRENKRHRKIAFNNVLSAYDLVRISRWSEAWSHFLCWFLVFYFGILDLFISSSVCRFHRSYSYYRKAFLVDLDFLVRMFSCVLSRFNIILLVYYFYYFLLCWLCFVHVLF